MSPLGTSPRRSPVEADQGALRKEGALAASPATGIDTTNSTSPRNARNMQLPSPQRYSQSSRSVRSNIHDILSTAADSQPLPSHNSHKRPYPLMEPLNASSSLSEPPFKRSRETSPTKHHAHLPGLAMNQQQAPAYALSGSARSLSTGPLPRLTAPLDEQGLSRKVSHENYQEERIASASDGSAEPDSSPSSSHQDRDNSYNAGSLPGRHQSATQERPLKKRFDTFETHSHDQEQY